MGDFGEPWIDSDSGYGIRDREKRAMLAYDRYPRERRIVACVNALAGIDDPQSWVERAKETERLARLVAADPNPFHVDALARHLGAEP